MIQGSRKYASVLLQTLFSKRLVCPRPVVQILNLCSTGCRFASLSPVWLVSFCDTSCVAVIVVSCAFCWTADRRRPISCARLPVAPFKFRICWSSFRHLFSKRSRQTRYLVGCSRVMGQYFLVFLQTTRPRRSYIVLLQFVELMSSKSCFHTKHLYFREKLSGRGGFLFFSHVCCCCVTVTITRARVHQNPFKFCLGRSNPEGSTATAETL